jgi:hypothetical protein
MEEGKCADIGWFTLEETKNLKLTITGQKDIEALQKKYPHELPIL